MRRVFKGKYQHFKLFKKVTKMMSDFLLIYTIQQCTLSLIFIGMHSDIHILVIKSASAGNASSNMILTQL